MPPRQFADMVEPLATQGPFIIGKKPIGRATVAMFDINEPALLEMRAELQSGGDSS